MYAVKRLSPWHQIDFPFLLENEVTGLNYANLSNTPRVVKYKKLFVLSVLPLLLYGLGMRACSQVAQTP